MLGKRSDQKGLWEADRLYLAVGKDTFYGLLASLRGQLFSDDDFWSTVRTMAGTACRPACWPRRCCCRPTTLDAEAKARADFDIPVALG